MVCIRIDEAWKQDPSTLRGLRALAQKKEDGFSPRDIIAVLRFVVDDVDLAQGTAETSVLDAMESLLEASRTLVSRDGEERVLLKGSETQIWLERRGEELRLKVIPFEDSSDVPSVELNPSLFHRAVQVAALRFIDELCEVAPRLKDSRLVGRLRQKAIRKPGRGVAGRIQRSALKAPSASQNIGGLSLAIEDDPPRLILRGAHGQVAWQSSRKAVEAGIELVDLMCTAALRFSGSSSNRTSSDLCSLGQSAERLSTAGFPTAGLETSGLKTSGLKTSGLKTAGLKTAGLKTAGLKTAGLETRLLSSPESSSENLSGVGLNVERQTMFLGPYEFPFRELGRALELLFGNPSAPISARDRRKASRALAALFQNLPTGILSARPADEVKNALLLELARPSSSSTSIRSGPRPSGELRHLFYRRVALQEFPGDNPSFVRNGRNLLLRTSEGIGRIRSNGSFAWFQRMRWSKLIRMGRSRRIVGQSREGDWLVLAPRSGKLLRRDPLPQREFREVHVFEDSSALLLGDSALLKISAEAELEWIQEGEFHEAMLRGGSQGAIFVDGRQDLLGLSKDGEVLWRQPLLLEEVSHLISDATPNRFLYAGPDLEGHFTVFSRSSHDGRIRWRHTFPDAAQAEISVFGGSVWAGFSLGRRSLLSALRRSDGKVLWTRALPGEGTVKPAFSGRQILIAREGGALCSLSLSGRARYFAPEADSEPELSPGAFPPALVGDGVVLSAGICLHVYEQESGRLLCSLDPHMLAPDAVTLSEEGMIHAAGGSDGFMAIWEPRGGLGVLRGGRRG